MGYYFVSFPWWARMLQRWAARFNQIADDAAVYRTPDGRRAWPLRKPVGGK